MKLGLLADIHENVEFLEKCIEALRSCGVTKFVMLGDVFETGRRLEETAAVLAGLDSVGVWGNHDFGLCRDVSDKTRSRFSPRVLDYFATLKPWLELTGARFQHVEPFLDSESLEEIWSYGSEGLANRERIFGCCPHRRMFMGHVHRWSLITPDGNRPWKGELPMQLEPNQRYLITVHAVTLGWCAWYDSDEDVLCPMRVGTPDRD